MLPGKLVLWAAAVADTEAMPPPTPGGARSICNRSSAQRHRAGQRSRIWAHWGALSHFRMMVAGPLESSKRGKAYLEKIWKNRLEAQGQWLTNNGERKFSTGVGNYWG